MWCVVCEFVTGAIASLSTCFLLTCQYRTHGTLLLWNLDSSFLSTCTACSSAGGRHARKSDVDADSILAKTSRGTGKEKSELMTDTNPVQDARTRTKAPTLLTICVEVYTINLWPSDPLSHFVSLEVKSVPVCVTCMRVSKNAGCSRVMSCAIRRR